ncbi:MAG: NUDIX domain-containing protein [Ruminococcus albus]|nr:NUDIX domain-containing protein [Ruminococcus albus]
MADYITYLRTMVGHEAVIMAAACAVIEDGGRILLQKRPSGLWGLPGGIAELGEALHETAVREAFEETGLITEARELVGIYSKYDVECTNGDKLQPVTALFRVEVVGGELRCDENETLELRYFGKEELPEIYCKQHRDMIDDWFAKRRGVFR